MTMLKKVLVVDDDPVVAKSFDRVLSSKGYAVITAANGEEALRKIAAEDYDAVYTDIRMPGMDGIEVATRIKGERPWLPVVIVTGYGSEENLERAKAAGVERVLHKPLSPAMIEGSAHEITLAERPAAPVEMHAAAAHEAVPAEAPARGVLGFAKNVALFFAAPLVGFAYVLAFPFIAMGLIGSIAWKALGTRAPRLTGTVKRVGMFATAPLIGLAYTIVLPFVGLGMLVWLVAKPLLARTGRE